MEICTVGSVRGEGVGAAMVNLNGHEAGNGGHSQGTPKAHRPLSYSERLPVSAFTGTSAITCAVPRLLLLTFSASRESNNLGFLLALYDVNRVEEYASTLAAACGTDNLPVCRSIFRSTHERWGPRTPARAL